MLYVSVGSRANPTILGVCSWVALCCLFVYILVLYSAGSGVNSVYAFFLGLSMR